MSDSESEGEEGDEEYEQLPGKQLFKILDECCDETKLFREWHTKKERGVSGRATNQNILRGAEGPRGRAKAAKTPV